MDSFRYAGLLLLALCLSARPGQAQKTDLSPLLPVRPQALLPATLGQAIGRRPAPPVPDRPSAPATTAAGARQPSPLLVLNSRLITGMGGLSEINPRDIEKIVIYKGYPGDATPAQWRSLAANGIIDMTLKKKIRLKSQSLAQLGRHLKVRGPIGYSINGQPATSSALRIATEGIEELKLARTGAGTTVGVWLLQSSSKPTPPHPPGTIMIRGTASR